LETCVASMTGFTATTGTRTYAISSLSALVNVDLNELEDGALP
jgi:hypothetical protein